MDLSQSALGKKTEYPQGYDSSLLQPISRELGRTELGSDYIDFQGVDIWYAYEFSWLNPIGKPEIAVIRFTFPASNPYLIESKSFKLYLNSFNNEHLERNEVIKLLTGDLKNATRGDVSVEFFNSDEFENLLSNWLEGRASASCVLNLDELDIDFFQYYPDPNLLQTEEINGSDLIEEELESHLLKSNCPVTGQPDWATVHIKYSSDKKINHEGLLRYIVSYRNHSGFHEQCVERIYADIWKHCQPKYLSVFAMYTRRGGLDINPFRETAGSNTSYNKLDDQRQFRQ
ncbi:NADPH-dependent 7-cyano-7-deazaguanine reductase QueF [Taylorella equigenitalis]|uniref:NADPH dependent preQ0 reductase n=3 Tax=Taylorella equigenitalis TaxID=29575 RepID=A0A654KHA9_TAYEM|nr:NADPH-dependent 7-cyano-7-deazaguanine reductase QueF [Taylorella equigenitalis]ADU91833.1 NADPH dependent preQ0 reductase [Taylorella equigenitalis MCE9]AFN35398.1 NADPH-dependent 7-cyano-7-deazaguanine reductase [Taylorella equigenitalis ATCC 35865]ASY30057.1 NADPH-dependent 7-cyano-7-deazaguanine reductase QueF [Taylorella equigenitalis]ASY37362.1 NADPH-dependent 7-cyano-7-deazaguanine reductase QueF [Taylorella equigenitalis]ASY38829.1 NADPH-dependent 7-cyano-7-deazaguanine reductase Qu